MAQTTENNLRLELPDVGLDSNIWGNILNTMFSYFELAITGIESIVVTGGNYDLDITGSVTDEARKAILSFTGALTSNATITAPNEPKVYVVRNGTTGSWTLGIKTPTGAVLDIPQNETYLVWCNGANVFRTINAQISGTVAQATNALQLGGVVAANYARLGIKQNWSRPQTVVPENVVLSLGAYTPNADTQSQIRVQQAQVITDVTINNPTGTPADGQIMIVEVEQHNVTPRSIVWGTSFVFEDGTDLNLTQTINRVDSFAFQYSAGLARWLIKGAVQNVPRS